MEIIPEAFLEQNLFVRGHEMRDPDGREQCKWHLQMRSVHKGAEMQVGKPREMHVKYRGVGEEVKVIRRSVGLLCFMRTLQHRI